MGKKTSNNCTESNKNMSSELTDKTRVVVTRLGDYWVTPAQSETIALAMEASPNGHLDFDGQIVRVSAIDGILDPPAYQELQLKKRGGWQCKYQRWHERGQGCAHGQLLHN